MRKIVVFDTGWGGELVANYLTHELEVVEVVRVIDWAHESCVDETLDIDIVIALLKPYIGRIDLIVLGGYGVGMLLRELRHMYPGQAFVAPGVNYDKLLRTRRYPDKVAILMNNTMRDSAMFQELREKLAYSTLILPECGDWEHLIDNNLMTKDIVRMELGWDFEVNICKRERELKTMRCKRGEQFSPLEMLAEKSLEKRALMRAIQNFGVAAEQALREEELVAIEAEQTQEERARIRPDLVLLLNTHFWEIKPEIERSLGWQVRVLDFREKLLHDVCRALNLRGVDGRRAK